MFRQDVDKLFREHDKDGDGKLSWKEFAGEETENKNERAFKLMDQNHDGKISKLVSCGKRKDFWNWNSASKYNVNMVRHKI
jgi:Ca2+-binding EF-hand superfamily protein